MPIEVIELDGGLGNRLIGRGNISAKEYCEAISQHLSKPDEQLKRYLYSISDYAEVTKFEANLAYITKTAKKSIEISKVNPQVVVVVIVADDKLYGIAKIWSGLCKLSGWKIKVFRDREEGENWIKTEMDRKYPDLDLKYKA